MRKVVLVLVMLMVPGVLPATPTMGLYFDPVPGQMSLFPDAYPAKFHMYLFLHHADYWVTAVEYQLLTPDDDYPAGPRDIGIFDIWFPDKMTVDIGTPFEGHAISYWPPLYGASPGYNFICGYEVAIGYPCYNAGGSIADYRVVVGPHPGSGLLQGTFYPDNETFAVVGLTSVLCPLDFIAIEEHSWGAIKELFGE